MRLLILILLTLLSLNEAFAADKDNFCVIPVSTEDVLAADDNARLGIVSSIKTFEGSKHALFARRRHHKFMKLDGYSLKFMDQNQFPAKPNVYMKYYRDSEGNIYASLSRKGLYKQDKETGEFSELPGVGTSQIGDGLEPILNKKQAELDLFEPMDFDYKHKTVSYAKQELEPIFALKTRKNKMNLAKPQRLQELGDFFVSGFLLHPVPMMPFIKSKELGTFRFKNGGWDKLSYKDSNDSFFEPHSYSSVLEAFFVRGREYRSRRSYHYYLYDKHRELHRLTYDKRGHLNVIDIRFLDKVLLKSRFELLLVDKDKTINTVELPSSLNGVSLKTVVELPKSKVSFLLTENGDIHLIDSDFKVSEEPIFLNNIFDGEYYRLTYLPVREELFLSTDDKVFIIADKRISDASLCLPATLEVQ